jgi:hypothetical protein
MVLKIMKYIFVRVFQSYRSAVACISIKRPKIIMSSSWRKEERSHCQRGYTKSGEAFLKGKAQYG